MTHLATKKFKCPLCPKVYISKVSLYNHLSEKHENELHGLSPAHFYFNFRNKKTSGKCVICGRPTEFDEDSERYNRFDRNVCKEKYKEQFKARMTKKYGSVYGLMNDPDHQKKMLANRKISGEYKWSDGTKFTYTGTYEEDFLEYCDKELEMSSKEIVAPAPQVIEYYYKNAVHKYIPDFWLVNYNLIVEVKGSNKHYRDRDIAKELTKDKVITTKTKYNYIKILDKKYDEFLTLLRKIKDKS